MPEPLDPRPHPAPSFVRRHRRNLTVAGSVAMVVAVFIAVTGVTGFEAPSVLRRYPYRDLRDLATEINATAGDLRTPDDCWRVRTDRTGPRREIAKVDYVRSRVVVRLYIRNAGRVDRGTRIAADRKIDDLLAADPHRSRHMIEIEGSPDGWSPTLSCRLLAGP